MALVWPSLTLTVLVLLFGAYALVDGVFALVASAALAGQGHERWLPPLLGGVVGIALGIATWVWPDITALALLYLIAAWAIVTGVFEIAASELRRVIENEWLLGLRGLASVLFGLLLIVFPGSGALALLWLIGTYAVLFGVLLIALGFRLRGMRDDAGVDVARRGQGGTRPAG